MPILENLRLGDMAKGEPLPEGVYHVRINKAEERINAEKPDAFPYLNVDYVVCGGSPEEHHGRHVFENCTYEPGKNFSLRQLATAVFGEDDDLDVIEVIREGKFSDAELQVAVAIDKEGKGKDGKFYAARNSVKKRLPLRA